MTGQTVIHTGADEQSGSLALEFPEGPALLGLAWQLGFIAREFAAETGEWREAGAAERAAGLACIRESDAITALRRRAEGAGSVLIALCGGQELQTLVVRADSPIRTVRDLRGRRFGLPVAQNGDCAARGFALRGGITALEVHGLFHRHVTFTDVPDLSLAPLLNHKVDALYVRGIDALRASREPGVRVLFDLRNQPDRWVRANSISPRVITADRDLLLRRPDIGARILRCAATAQAWAHLQPAQTLQRIAAGAGITCEDAGHVYGSDPAGFLGMDPDHSGLAALQNLKQFLLRWKLIWEDFDLSGWIDPRPLIECRSAFTCDDEPIPFPMPALSAAAPSDPGGRKLAHRPSAYS